MSRLITNGIPEAFPPNLIPIFLREHIPYRLKLLELGRMVSPAGGWIDSAMVEAGLIHGRQLLQFAGLGINHTSCLDLAECQTYHIYKDKSNNRYTDEVKITDLGGAYVLLADLQPEERKVLADFYNTASKATAHMTDGHGHNMSPKIYDSAITIIIRLILSHLPSLIT